MKGCKNKTETICIQATLHLIAMPQTKTKNKTKIQQQLTSLINSNSWKKRTSNNQAVQ